MKKIQRHETLSTSQPPRTGPTTTARAVSADQVPIARPRCSPLNVALMMARPARHEQRAADALQGSRGDQLADARGQPRPQGGQRKDGDADGEHAAAAVAIAEHAADEDEGGQKQHVGLDDPLQGGQAGIQLRLQKPAAPR